MHVQWNSTHPHIKTMGTIIYRAATAIMHSLLRMQRVHWRSNWQSVVTLEKKLEGIAMAKDGMSQVCFFQIPKSTVQSNPALYDKRSSTVSVQFSLGVVVSEGHV